MSRLEIFALGPFRATLNGNPVTRFGTDAARALLAYLAFHPQAPCRRETLAGLLWPNQPEAEARHSLRQTLTRLRKAIADRESRSPFLLVSRKAIQLNPQADCWLDVTAFNDRIATCKGHRHRRLGACRSCIRRLREAVDLYRGEVMAGFSLPSAPFEEWLVTERERLHRQALDALHHLAAHHERRAEHEQAQHYARRQLELEPWREGAHRQLMRALALSGQRGAALSQYEACCRVLAQELGVEPDAETTDLYSSIRDETKRCTLSRVPPHNLPAPLTPFVGREAEMAQIQDRLQDPDCRLLTLVGLGGIGKTRLALEAATTQVHAFTHGAFFVSLAPLRSAEAIVPAIARALGFSFYEGKNPRQQLLDYVREKNILLVLDSLEHLLACPERSQSTWSQRSGVGFVTDVLQTAADVSILVTSRERLNVQGEHLFPVAGMDFPVAQGRLRAGQPDQSVTGQGQQPLSRYSAVKLFLRSAQRVRPGFEPMDTDLAHIAQICRLVRGMPLGILLAAAWMQVLSPAEIAARIAAPRPGHGLDFLQTDLRDIPQRHRSMRAVFDHSWNLLTEREREVFRALSVFRGGFTQQAAQQVTGATLHELRALANKSLLQRMPAPSTALRQRTAVRAQGRQLRARERYGVHELLRQYAAEKLAQSPDACRAARDRHCAYYVASLRRWDADLKGLRQKTALAEMVAEVENVYAAWDWAAERGQVARLNQAIDGLCRFYERRGRYHEGRAACQMAAEKLATTPSADGLQVLARILAWQGALSRRLGRTELASQLLQQSLALLQEPRLADHDIRLEKAFILLQMSHIASDSDREQAKQLCRQSLALYQALGDPWKIANALAASGERAENLGAYDEARQLFEKSLAQRQTLGDRRGIADSLRGLAMVANRLGQLEEAQRLLRESIQIRQSLGDRVGVAEGLHELAVTLLFGGEFAQAHVSLKECMATYEDLGDRANLAHAYTLLGHIHEGLGQYKQAHACGRTGLALSQEAGFRRGIGLSLLLLGSAALAEGAYAEARDSLRESVAVVHKIGHRHDLSLLALVILGYAERGLGDLGQAQQHLCEGLRVTAEIGAFMPLPWALPAVALLLADCGQAEQAVELYALASRHPFVAHSRWFEDVVEKHIAAAAATLPPDGVAAAQERGRARDLDATIRELLAENVGSFRP